MIDWEVEAIDLINQGHFQIADPGPLHAPIRKFSVSRNDDLALILETEAAPDAKSPAIIYPSGLVRINIDQVKVADASANEAVLIGVQSFSVSGDLFNSQQTIKERARVHELTVTLNHKGEGTNLVEWLENVPSSPFIWPDCIKTTSETNLTRNIAASNDGLSISCSSGHQGTSNSAAKLKVEGWTLFLCARSEGRSADIKRGCIVYVGTPDDLTRKKIRCALSFALGFYLVEMGHTTFNKDWQVVSATSRSAYSLAKRTFDPGPMPLVNLSSRNFQYDLGRPQLGRIVNAFVKNYEPLDLGNISWAYWHAGTATVHIAPAHFGAAIEGLQDAYCKSRPNIGTTKILPTRQWKELRQHLNSVIDGAQIAQESKGMLKEKLQNINKPPQRVILKSLLEAIGVGLSDAENESWKRRNNAAHGTPIPEGEELAAIGDMHLLRVLFNRMLLRMCDAADNYIDYAAPGLPVRPL